jgi:hypothetical protein
MFLDFRPRCNVEQLGSLSGFCGGKIVRRLDEFPELGKALHDGDLLTGRLFCAQLFHFDERQSL